MGIETTKKLAYLAETKSLIKAALIEKGQAVSDTDTFRSYADKVLAIETGGGSGGGGALGTGEYFVKVVDYDGTVLSMNRLNEGDVFALPDAPTHAGLIFDGWSSSAPITDNTVTVAKNNIMIGPMYHTASGATEIDITMSETIGLTFAFVDSMLTGMTSIDWGDGTKNTSLTHTYSNYGNYTIKIYGMTAIADGVVISGYGQGFAGDPYRNSVVAIRFASGVASLGVYAFAFFGSLISVTIPNSVTSVKERTFHICRRLAVCILPIGVTTVPTYLWNSCAALTDVVIPYGTQTIENYAASGCNNLTHAVIPDTVTTCGYYIFNNCYSLHEIVIPAGITGTLQNNTFCNCYGLTKVTILGSFTKIGYSVFQNCYSLSDLVFDATKITSIGERAFQNCYALKTKLVFGNVTGTISSYTFSACYGVTEYDFTACTSVPSLSSNAFTDINRLCKILVPSSLYDTWVAKTNWSTYAANIVAG